MSLKPAPLQPVPEQTALVARAAFPKGSPYLTLRDQLGTLFEDQHFEDLFPPQGQPAQAPWRLALVTLMQFAENLSDRQAAEAVRSRIDWKYALGLELTDSGFDFSVLSEFRARLVAGQAEQRLLSVLLALSQEKGLLKARGRQRTDSTHVLGAIHALNRLEIIGETMRHALNVLAEVAPQWLREHMEPHWAERYGKRFENYRLPREATERKALAASVGNDGSTLLGRVYAQDAPPHLRELPAVQTLRRIWVQQFLVEEGQLRWREQKELPPAGITLNSPYDIEARYSMKRDTVWTGYKVHLTETCDPESPHLITHVATTESTIQDCDVTAGIHADLAKAQLLPSVHLADEGYLDAPLLVESQSKYSLELLGPVARDGSWQAVAGHGFDAAAFTVDWEAQKVTCPQGKLSRLWMPQKDAFDNDVIHVKFSATDCQVCPSRADCTRSQTGRRQMGLRPQEQYLALQQRRQHQKSSSFAERYCARAGIEGTLSTGIHNSGMRRSRYIGLAKTHLQNLAIAAALNAARLVAWLEEIPRATTRVSPFAQLCAAANLAT